MNSIVANSHKNLIENSMEIEKFNQERATLNKCMSDNDNFFKQFGGLDDIVYSEGAIPKKYKELTGLSISVLTRCEECILYHIQGCIAEKASKNLNPFLFRMQFP